MNEYILNIETSTKACSVALFSGKQLVSHKEHVEEKFSHSEKLSLYMLEVLDLAKITFTDLSAIAISMGPGSYTGLRIGVSTAKGLCYALDIPLISISTLQAMAYGISLTKKSDVFCPMIDARRMEVYSAFYNAKNKLIRKIQADIIDEKSYQKELTDKVLFFGDGSEKLHETIIHDNASFVSNFHPSAKFLGPLAFNKFQETDFEDTAYFEPYYLKDFIAGKKN
ncbi:MAG: tRNA (adenosine(37)-N6)-threonylcarbamoyltransferase complex dimerization subunit type 1 TsaB [Flavobacteriales bacterium]|jgi:tRNA threonylcarbamoyladenosine biosynthesis protein TsaB|tara:strand:- start:496 stop:1170 length:675 start_codon:yes stop_codon:yes gene_type:complete